MLQPVGEAVISQSEVLTSPTYNWQAVESALKSKSAGQTWTENFSASPEMVVGQEQQQAALEEFYQTAQPGEILLLQGRFGSGKTTIRETVQYKLGISDKEALVVFASGFMPGPDPEPTFQKFLDIERQRNSKLSAEEVKFIIVEEIGRVDDAIIMEEILTTLRQLRVSGQLPPIIFTGEETLDDPNFFEALGCTPTEVKKIVMDPLTPGLLQKAVGERLRYSDRVTELEDIGRKVRSTPVSQIIERLRAFEAAALAEVDVTSLFDPDFLEIMLYPTDYGSVNFRDARKFLQVVARANLGDNAPARFDAASYKVYKNAYPDTDLSPSQKDCLAWLQTGIRVASEKGEPFMSLTAEEIMKGILGNTFGIQKYGKGVIDKLCDKGYLLRVNTSDFKNKRFTTKGEGEVSVRYLPAVNVFLDAFYDPIIVIDDAGIEYPVIQDAPVKDQANSLLLRYVSDINPERITPEAYKKASGQMILLLMQKNK